MKTTIVSAIALFMINAVVAQQSNVQFGVKGGINLTTFNDGENNNADARTGFHIGGLAHIHLSKTFAIQPEAVFSTQGAEYGNGSKYKLNYINVPLLGQYMFANGFRLQTGPQVGFLTSAKVENGNVEVDVDNSIKQADFGWSFGLGYITEGGLGFDGRYNLGLTDISKNNSDLKNRVWQIGLFYQFRH